MGPLSALVGALTASLSVSGRGPLRWKILNVFTLIGGPMVSRLSSPIVKSLASDSAKVLVGLQAVLFASLC